MKWLLRNFAKKFYMVIIRSLLLNFLRDIFQYSCINSYYKELHLWILFEIFTSLWNNFSGWYQGHYDYT